MPLVEVFLGRKLCKGRIGVTSRRCCYCKMMTAVGRFAPEDKRIEFLVTPRNNPLHNSNTTVTNEI